MLSCTRCYYRYINVRSLCIRILQRTELRQWLAVYVQTVKFDIYQVSPFDSQRIVCTRFNNKYKYSSNDSQQ